MQTARLFPAVICGLALASVSAHPQGEPAAPLVLAGGTVVDVANWGHSARDIPDAIVVIRDGKITEVGLPGAVPIPKGARIIDCTGKFLIPGLVDGYAGLNSQAQANANLYMGVTTVVVRTGYQRGFIDSGAQPSPHIYPIDTIGVTDNWSLLARQPEWVSKLREGPHPAELSPQDTARQMVDTAHLGTRVLLLTPYLTAANSQWIIARAHEMGLITYGIFVATPYRVGVEAGVDALPQMDRYDLGVIPDELQRPLIDDPDGSSPKPPTITLSTSRPPISVCALTRTCSPRTTPRSCPVSASITSICPGIAISGRNRPRLFSIPAACSSLRPCHRRYDLRASHLGAPSARNGAALDGRRPAKEGRSHRAPPMAH